MEMLKTKEFNISSSECDFNYDLRPKCVLDLFQDMAGCHADEIGVGYEEMLKKGYYWVVMYNEYEVIGKLPKRKDNVKVTTFPHERNRLEFPREYYITDKDGNMVIKGISNWVVIDTVKRMISRATDVDFKGEYYTKSNYEGMIPRKLGLVPHDITDTFEYKVAVTDIDANHHLNNAKYLDIISDMQGVDNYYNPKKVKIAFVKEALYNDVLKVVHYREEEKDCYIGYVNDKTCFEAVLEK